VGQQSPEQVEQWIDQCFGAWKGNSKAHHDRKKPNQVRPKRHCHRTDNHQAHYVSGCRAVDVHHKDRRIVALMTNYLGGPALNSRLSYELREKNGIAYHIEANYTPFHDCGMFSIYAGTSEESLAKMEKLIQKELDRLANGKINAANLKAMKKQISGQLTLASESASSEMFHMARSILLYNTVESHAEIIQSIEDITLQNFNNVSANLLDSSKFSTLIYI
jgi:predicted Zn-dependent peptidase